MRIVPIIALLLLFSSLHAQIDQPKREFRAVWVATVANIDFPREGTPNAIAHQEQWKNLLDQYKKIGLNAVIVQIRPAGDALYPTELAPWSKYLTGKQGRAPEPMYDPLEFMIREAHDRGLEFHAWLNPYRATMDLDTTNLAPNHAFRTHRDWMIKYGNRFYFNPALPAVRQHVTDIVMEVVNKYNVDAIHFDDYFYPYKVKDEVFPDSMDFWRYGGGFNRIEDWRRNNVDSLIQKISTAINETKPYVKFGISPFGVWRNKDKDPTGSDTRAGATTYDDLYADVVKWMRLGWIDYLIPQLYWNIGFAPADHATLLGWWGARSYERELYIGHAAYKVQNNPEPAWSDPNEIPRQIQLNRRNALTKGSAFFSSKSILENRLGLRDTLMHYYRTPALIPTPADAALKAYHAPRLKKARYKDGRVLLKWKVAKEDKKNLPAYYVVYRFRGTKIGDFEDAENIMWVSPFFIDNPKFCFIDGQLEQNANYTYVVVAVNREHMESKASEPKVITIGKPKV